MAWPTVTIAGVDRTSCVSHVHPMTIDDTRSATPSTCLFTIEGQHGYVPAHGATVTAVLGGRSLFGGQIVSVEQARTDGHVYYHCQCTGWGRLLNTKRVWGRWVSTSASTIVANIITNFTSGFTANGVEAAMATVDEIQFTDASVTDALSAVMERVGGRWYVNEAKDIRAFTTLPESGIEQPDALTDTNCQNITTAVDWSDVITRQWVAGEGSTTVAPVTAGDTTIPVARAAAFPTTGAALVAGARVPYTGKLADYASNNIAAGVTVPAGPFRVAVYTISGLPAAGWYRTQDGVYFKYSALSPWDTALLLPGYYAIRSITRVGTTATLETVSAYTFVGGAYSITIHGTGNAGYDGQTFNMSVVDATHLSFTVGTSPADVGQVGYCGRAGNWPINSIVVASGVATITFTYSHRLTAGDWVTIAGNSIAEYNGTWLVTGADATTATFNCPNARWTGAGGSGQFASVPMATIAASTNLVLCEALTGVSAPASLASGASVSLMARCDDGTAQTALAAVDGSDGIREGELISDASLTATAAVERGEAELAVRKDPDVRLAYETNDPKTRAGTLVTVAVGNRLGNSEFKTSLVEPNGNGAMWAAGYGTTGAAWAVVQNAVPTGSGAAVIYTAASPASGYQYLDGPTFDVAQGQAFEFSAYLGMLRLESAVVWVAWLDSGDSVISSGGGSVAGDPAKAGTASLGLYSRASGIFVAPANAVKARLSVRFSVNGQAAPALYVTHVQWKRAVQGQAGPSEWAPAWTLTEATQHLITRVSFSEFAANKQPRMRVETTTRKYSPVSIWRSLKLR